MALKDILIYVDDGEAAEQGIAAAIRLAREHQAHLIGLHVTPVYTFTPFFASTYVGPELVETQRKMMEAAAEAAEKRFRAAIEKSGLQAEWRRVEGELPATLNRHARYVDLVVIGQVAEGDPKVLPDLPGQVILESGRPVLIVPYAGAPQAIGRRVLVAWNASREAVQAVNDALPLLEKAERVTVLAVNPPSGEEGLGDIPCADVCQHLARHGVKAEAAALTAHDLKVGEILLARAADESVDLIVMGGYGHSRLREIVLGGATRHLLRHMTVPVLMSH